VLEGVVKPEKQQGSVPWRDETGSLDGVGSGGSQYPAVKRFDFAVFRGYIRTLCLADSATIDSRQPLS
jgi:hypothetical protein